MIMMESSRLRWLFFLLILIALSGPLIVHAFTSSFPTLTRSSVVVCGKCGRTYAAPNNNVVDAKDSGSAKKLRVVVVGGGWAGYSFCESISTNNIHGDGIEIILLDAQKRARGGLAGGFRSSNDRPVEAGIHGFWREYKNTFDIMKSINGVDVDGVLGDFSPSALYSKNGAVAVASVLLEDVKEEGGAKVLGGLPVPKLDEFTEESIRRLLAAYLPPPLDLPLLAELDKRESGDAKLNTIDLLSGLGLLGAWADFEQESPSSWKNYDTQPASLLFDKAGITDAMYEELVSPLLHVLPMCPAYDCSAAAALSCFHVFALQSRGAFDVRWCKGSISEMIFEPWQRQLEKRGVVIRGGARVASIEKRANQYEVRLDSTDGDCIIDCDAVVLAVGTTAAGKLAASSPALSSLEATKDFDKLRGVTCVAVRLFLKPSRTITSDLSGGLHGKTQVQPEIAKEMQKSPVAVCGASMGDIEVLRETRFCIYDLQRMHDEFSVDYYSDNVAENDQVAVLEIDFFRANDFVDLDDDQISDLALRAVSAALGTPKIDSADIVDATVLRARNAVSHFCPNSALYSPSVKLGESRGMYICGDWVDRTGHASWSTEKAVVTARQAASVLSNDFGLMDTDCNIIPAAKDTPQLSALRKVARLLRSTYPPTTLPPSPWIYVKELLSGVTDP
ncbi:hypothetical protein ACHAWF_004824 [Thalassiosira exigua]